MLPYQHLETCECEITPICNFIQELLTIILSQISSKNYIVTIQQSYVTLSVTNF
jgi:hypothetical protein